MQVNVWPGKGSPYQFWFIQNHVISVYFVLFCLILKETFDFMLYTDFKKSTCMVLCMHLCVCLCDYLYIYISLVIHTRGNFILLPIQVLSIISFQISFSRPNFVEYPDLSVLCLIRQTSHKYLKTHQVQKQTNGIFKFTCLPGYLI